MAVSWTAMEQGHIWNFLVERCGSTKDQAAAQVTAMQGDAINMLLLPNPSNWNEVLQCAVACKRKSMGSSPIVLTLLEILGLA